MNVSEFERLFQGEFTIANWQKELLENIELLHRYTTGVYVGGRWSPKWEHQLMYLRACWEMGESTTMFSMDVEPVQRIHVIYDDLASYPGDGFVK